MTVEIIHGDCRAALEFMPSTSVNCIVTSPPYFGLRDYGVDGQIGLEATPDAYVAEMVAVFREARRVLCDDGTLWLNLGDTYNNNPSTSDIPRTEQGNGSGAFQIPPEKHVEARRAKPNKAQPLINAGIKKKDLIGIPWRVAFALQADGWYLRQDIIWSKPNPMPESVRDRCTKAHEYIFLLSKSDRYYFDAASIAEPLAASSIERLSQPTLDQQQGSDRVPGKTNGRMKAVGPRFGGNKYGDDESELTRTKSGNERTAPADGKRNKRSVWTVTTKPFKEAHFATFPPDLIEPCILAGCPPGGTVLDPFFGAGTTGLVAQQHGRHAIGIELNAEYIDIAKRRLGLVPEPQGVFA